MKRATHTVRKRPDRIPAGGLNSALVGVRLDESTLTEIDEWRREQPDLPSRPEAMRRLIEIGLKRHRA